MKSHISNTTEVVTWGSSGL